MLVRRSGKSKFILNEGFGPEQTCEDFFVFGCQLIGIKLFYINTIYSEFLEISRERCPLFVSRGP